MRVMSFNIRGALHFDGWNSWPLRRPLIRDLLVRQLPTIVGFQEVLWPVQHFLARDLPQHAMVLGASTGHWLFAAHNPVFFAPPLRLLRAGSFWLSETPDQRSLSWGALQVRAATWLSLADEGRPFLFVNTHLDHGNAMARDNAGGLIIDRLRSLGWPDNPAVVVGDFNSEGGSALHKTLVSAGLRDTFRDSGHADDDSAFTFHGFEGRRFPGERRIDWILCSPPLRPTHTEIVRDARPPIYPSDHYPIVADLEWRA